MKTFFNILQSLIGITNKSYPDEPFNIQENIEDSIYFKDKGHLKTFINTIFYKIKQCNKENIFSKNAFGKFSSLNSILENTFYQKELKELIFDFFQKTQKHYFAFTRLAHIYRLKKNKYVVTNDLMMNPLDPNHKLTFVLVQNKSIFLFNINEIINIIETAIGHAPHFFCEPLSPLNPYNNQEFTISSLYNIYFQMKNIGRVIPLLFHLFFLENFNKNSFLEQYEPNIREYAIKKYVFNSPHTELYPSVISMLRNNEYTKKLIIHKEFPKDLLVDIFRPFLFHDYISNYYIKHTSKYYNSRQLLHIKLKKFYQFNKEFGRKIIKLTKKNKKVIKKEYILNTKHISFYDIPVLNNDKINSELQWHSLNTLIYFLRNTPESNNTDTDENDDYENDNETQIEENGQNEETDFLQNNEYNSTSEDDYPDENDSVS